MSLDPVSARPRIGQSSAATAAFAIAFGCLLSLTLTGYQIGQSNHTVYLLDAIRHADPELLTRDWFTNGTLQYHGLFSLLTRWCIRTGMLQPVFLIGYLLTVLAFHLAIYRLVWNLRGRGEPGEGKAEENKPAEGALRTGVTYLLTVVLFHLSAGGTGLGGFQFLQDSAFLPSNVSNVAMFWGVVLMMELRVWWAAVALGLSGVFHINHAVFAGPLFAVGMLALPGLRQQWKGRVAAGLLVAAMCLINLGPALLHLKGEPAAAGGPLPLPEFVDIYAKLRHPHHYYPRAWNPFVYIGALWTYPLAAWVLLRSGWRMPEVSRRMLMAVAMFLNVATVLALIFAGVVYVSERLVQMAVFRFTIYPILFSCAVCAWGLFDAGAFPRRLARAAVWIVAGGLVVGVCLAASGLAGPVAEEFVRQRPVPFVFAALLVAGVAGLAEVRDRVISGRAGWLAAATTVALLLLAWNAGWLGLNFLRVDPEPYTRLAHWARDHTPKDALFIVPPNDQAWRLSAQRSIFINFKAIPQTAREMPEWKRRMQLLTGVQDLPSKASTFNSALKTFGEIYFARPEPEMVALARAVGARYVVTTAVYSDLKRVGPPEPDTAPYRMYDLAPQGTGSTSPTTIPTPTPTPPSIDDH